MQRGLCFYSSSSCSRAGSFTRARSAWRPLALHVSRRRAGRARPWRGRGGGRFAPLPRRSPVTCCCTSQHAVDLAGSPQPACTRACAAHARACRPPTTAEPVLPRARSPRATSSGHAPRAALLRAQSIVYDPAVRCSHSCSAAAAAPDLCNSPSCQSEHVNPPSGPFRAPLLATQSSPAASVSHCRHQFTAPGICTRRARPLIHFGRSSSALVLLVYASAHGGCTLLRVALSPLSRPACALSTLPS